MSDPTYQKNEHFPPNQPRAMLPKKVVAALHSDQGQPYDVRGRPARLHATPRGLRVSFAECGSGFLSFKKFGEDSARGMIRPVTERAYADWMKRLASEDEEVPA